MALGGEEEDIGHDELDQVHPNAHERPTLIRRVPPRLPVRIMAGRSSRVHG